MEKRWALTWEKLQKDIANKISAEKVGYPKAYAEAYQAAFRAADGLVKNAQREEASLKPSNG